MKFRKKNTKKLSDESLMKNICEGDQISFNELYERYNNRLFYYFYRMLGSSEETANDFLQDIYLKIIEKPQLYNPEYNFSKWIFSVAHNMCKNEYRKRDVRKIIIREENPDRFLEINEDTTYNTNKLIDLAFNSIDGLSEKSKEVLLLKYRENFSIKEIVEITGITEGTIKSRLYYARMELSAVLNRSEINNK